MCASVCCCYNEGEGHILGSLPSFMAVKYWSVDRKDLSGFEEQLESRLKSKEDEPESADESETGLSHEGENSDDWPGCMAKCVWYL